MRVILDTNVLLAALISPYGAPHVIYKAWRRGRFALVTSVAQLDELRRVSRYPKLREILPAHRIGAMVNNLQRATVLHAMAPLPDGIETIDPNDDFLLTMALDCYADYVVTGDRRAGLLSLRSIGVAQIVTPGDFCARSGL